MPLQGFLLGSFKGSCKAAYTGAKRGSIGAKDSGLRRRVCRVPEVGKRIKCPEVIITSKL